MFVCKFLCHFLKPVLIEFRTAGAYLSILAQSLVDRRAGLQGGASVRQHRPQPLLPRCATSLHDSEPHKSVLARGANLLQEHARRRRRAHSLPAHARI